MKIVISVAVWMVCAINIYAQSTGSNFTTEEAVKFTRDHNILRNNFMIPSANVDWDDSLAKEAQEWANYLKANGGSIKHRPKNGKYATKHGENIAYFYGYTKFLMEKIYREKVGNGIYRFST